MAHAWAHHLHEVVHRHQKARQQRRQGQLDDHDAIQCRRGEHNDGAEAGLHQAKPNDSEPAEVRSHGVTAAERNANALTIMPATNSGTPKPL